MDVDHSACVSSNDSSEIVDCFELINATNDYYPTLKLPVYMVALYGVVYCSIFLTAVVGNVMVVAVVVRTPRMQTVTNFFIVNLAVLDILVAVVCIPVTFLDNIFYGWPFGHFLCKAVPYIQGVCVCASVYNLGAIAMDRFLAVCAHSKWRIMKRGAIAILCFIWVFSFAVQTPWAIFYQHWALVTRSETFYICAGIWPDFNSQRAFFVLAIFVGTYLLPLSFVFLCYTLIAWHVWHRRPPGVALGSRMIQRCRNKVIMMLITVVLMFALSWLPLHVLFLVMYFDPPSDQVVVQRINDVGVPLAQLLELSNTGMNVFIYSFFSGNFRRGFKQLCHLLPCNRNSAAGNPISTRRSMSENSTLLARSRSVQILFSNRCDRTRNFRSDNGQPVKPPYLRHVFQESVISLTNVSKTDPV